MTLSCAPETVNRLVPSPALIAGNITDPVTGAVTSLASVDPRGIGINPLVQQIWKAYEPQSNATCSQNECDGANVLGFTGNVALPTTSNFAVGRVDHDFGAKWHFMSTYRWNKLTANNDNQVDIGGFFPGDTKGVPASIAKGPLQSHLLVAGLTTNITTNTTNDFHYSFLRNWWAYARQGDTPQTSTLGGALEILAAKPPANTGFGALQRKHAEHPQPNLGWARSDVSRRRFHVERQPPVPVWRYLSAQLGLPSAHR